MKVIPVDIKSLMDYLNEKYNIVEKMKDKNIRGLADYITEISKLLNKEDLRAVMEKLQEAMEHNLYAATVNSGFQISGEIVKAEKDVMYKTQKIYNELINN